MSNIPVYSIIVKMTGLQGLLMLVFMSLSTLQGRGTGQQHIDPLLLKTMP